MKARRKTRPSVTPSKKLRRRHYPNAPIVEAVIDLQTKFIGAPTATDFSSLKTLLQDRFPVATELHHVKFGLNVVSIQDRQPTSHSEAQVGSVGWRLVNATNTRVLMVGQRGFTYSHLAPYSSWPIFEKEAKDLWRQFISLARPLTVERIAVRFINRIEIPKKRFEAKEFFNLYPRVPSGIPEDISGLVMQLQMPQKDVAKDATAVINVALLQPEKKDVIPVLLDIDIFAQRQIAPDAKVIWSMLRRFRKRKNEIFEACVTDKARRLFL